MLIRRKGFGFGSINLDISFETGNEAKWDQNSQKSPNKGELFSEEIRLIVDKLGLQAKG